MECVLIFLALQTAAPTGDIGWVENEFASLFKLIFVLLGILVLAYFVLRFALPRMLGVDNTGSGPISLVARYSLEPRKSLYVVQVGKEFFLVGTSETNIQFLTSLDPGKLEPALSQPQSRLPGESEFARLLRGWKRSQKP
jgi:flagellar biosynthetic protein FliO